MTYDEIKAVNWSSLKHLTVSPLLYQWRVNNPAPRTAALTLGSAIHCLLFEPEKFDSRFAVFDGTRRGKEWVAFLEQANGAEPLRPAEMAKAAQTAAAIQSHREAARLIAACRVEEVTTWTDAETGLACKGRQDNIAPNYVLDLKSARDVVPRAFERASALYLYHGQLAFYHDGAVAAGKLQPGADMPYIIAAQNDEPYDVVVYQLAQETLEAGRSLYRSLLHKLIACEAANYWPGCAPEIATLGIPPWIEAQTVNVEGEDF